MRFNPTGDDSRPRIDDYLEATGNKLEADSYKSSTYAWNPNEDETKILRVTKSSYGTFGWCPQQYYLEKFKGLRGETVDHHIRGLNVHDMMEWFWANFTGKEEALALIASGDIDAAKAVFHDAIPQPPEPYEYGEDEQIHQWVEWQFHRLLYTMGEQWEPVAIEANIQATRFVEVNGEHIPIHMNGFIDGLFADNDGFALMELKTGKYNKNKPTAMRKEMQFYKMMLEHSPHYEYLPITHWGWEFPGGGINGGDGPTVFYEETKKGGRYAAKSIEKGLVRLVEAHINMEFPPDPGNNDFKCGWCSFQEHCEYWNATDDLHWLELSGANKFLDKNNEDEKND
jgi:hypothetical protein